MSGLFKRSHLLAIATSLVFLMPIGLAGFYFYQKHMWAEARLAEIAPRHARLLGMIESEPSFRAEQARLQERLSRFLIPAEVSAAQAGNDVQQRIRDLVTRAGLQVVSSQVMPAKTDGEFERLPLVFRVEGDLLALQALLIELGAAVPVVFVDGWSVQAVGAVRADTKQRLSAEINLSVLKARP